MFVYVLLGILVFLIIRVIHERFFETKHTLVKNFPIIGWGRYLFEKLGAPFRQYWFQGDREGGPYNRIRRSYVYASAKGQNRYRGFGTDDNQSRIGHLIIPHSEFPTVKPKDFDPFFLPPTKMIGPNRKRPFLPESIINVSAMSFGSTSKRAVMANNIGAALSGAFQNTGEGGIAPYHAVGGDIVYQIGTGYFGCRDKDGKFSLEKLIETVEKYPNVRAIEIKLSQGAKAGKGGILLAEKITEEISEIRGIPMGEDCISPAYHTAFSNVYSLIDFVEKIAEATGLPVGIKFCVGTEEFPNNLAYAMKETGKGPDFIAVDGGEGGTGAAPAAFADHVGLQFEEGFPIVYKAFQRVDLESKVVFIGSAKLGYPPMAIKALAMGCDMINVAREALFAIGCLQTQDCHKGNCPVGIATHNRWLVKGLNIEDKSTRLGLYLDTFKKDLWEITHACGLDHPSQFDNFKIRRALEDGKSERYYDHLKYNKRTHSVDYVDLVKLNQRYNGSKTELIKSVFDHRIKKAKQLSK